MKTIKFALIALGCAVSLFASPIEYRYSGTASGTVGATSYVSQSFLFSLTGDSGTVSVHSPGVLINTPMTSATLTWGTDVFTISTALRVFNNSSFNIVGFSVDSPFSDIFDYSIANSSLDNLASNFGPVSGTLFHSSLSILTTSGGSVAMNSLSDLSYQVVDGRATIPEPSSYLLTASAIVALLARRRKA